MDTHTLIHLSMCRGSGNGRLKEQQKIGFNDIEKLDIVQFTTRDMKAINEIAGNHYVLYCIVLHCILLFCIVIVM